MDQGPKTKMKATVLENATVFCISSSVVMEGHHFLTLVTCHLSPPAGRNTHGTRKYRPRTFSLPPSLEDLHLEVEEEDNPPEVFKLTSSCRSLSDDVLRISKRHQRSHQKLKPHWIDCMSGLTLNVTEKCDRKKGRKGMSKIVNTKVRIGLASKTKMHKSLVSNRQLGGSVCACTAASIRMDGYMLSYFIAELRRSSVFRTAFLRHWTKTGSNPDQREGYPLLVFVASMKHPEKEVLDLLGNKMVNSNILQRRSLEHALSWLSTLGGAFSALGDLSPTWAEEAGHVSLTQLRIAMKLGDPGIQSRCRLYAAISLLQRGYLKCCRDMVRREYQYAVSLPEGSDPRLRRMCLGVWSKLQYHWRLAAKTDKRMLNKSTEDGWKDIQSNAKYWNVYDLEEGRKIARPLDDNLSEKL